MYKLVVDGVFVDHADELLWAAEELEGLLGGDVCQQVAQHRARILRNHLDHSPENTSSKAVSSKPSARSSKHPMEGTTWYGVW